MNLYEKRSAERALAARGYFGYLRLCIKETTVYSICGKISSAVRKYALLSRILKIVTAAISLIKTSAALIVVFGVLAVLLPALILSGAVVFIAGAASYRRLDRYFGAVGGTVYVFAFCEKSRVSSMTAAELKERGEVVFVTSSRAACGFSGAKRRGGTLCVHVGYYFRMKKILEKNGVKIYFIS